MSVWVRPATPDDAAALAPLAQQTFRDGWAAIIGDVAADAYIAEHLTPERLARDIAAPGARYGIADKPGAGCVGYAKLDLARSVPPSISTPCACLQRLYVADAGRGTGIADLLLAWAQDEMRAQGRETLWLECDPRNERAWRFYEKRGFVPVARTTYVLPTGVNDNVWILARGQSGIGDASSLVVH